MHICVIAGEYPPVVSGISYYIDNLANELLKKDHDVTVFTRSKNMKYDEEIKDNLSIHRIPFINIYPFQIELHKYFLNKVFKKFESDFDIVHINHPLCPILNTKKPILSTIHSSIGLFKENKIEYQNFWNKMWIPTPFLMLAKKYLQYYEYRTIKNSDEITTVSRALADELSKHYDLEAEKISVSYNGVDTSFFTPSNIEKSGKTILYTGRLSWNKGLFDLVRAAKFVLESIDCHFLITGSGPIKNELKRYVENNNMQRNFTFTGFVSREELLRYYQEASIFLLPSYYEGLPTSLLEAMSCELPVISTNVGGIPEVLNPENGLLIPKKDPTAISDSIIKLLNDKKLSEKYGKNARQTILNQFSWGKISNNYIELYNSLLRK